MPLVISLVSRPRGQLVALDLVERDVTVGCVLPRHAQHAFTDDVAGDLGAAAPQATPLPPEISMVMSVCRTNFSPLNSRSMALAGPGNPPERIPAATRSASWPCTT